MHLVTVYIITINLLSGFAFPDNARTWKSIQADLESLYEGLKQSDYWKNNHHKNLNLYTAWSDNYVPEECEKTFFDCYVRELKVIEEELNLFGVHNRSAIINKIHHIEHNIQVAIQITESMTANCNKCEQYEEKPIEEFKKSFVTLTQKMQSNANGKK
ncbi:interleukin-15-like isoform X7 [Pseudophryne corroboree]|uniref:interleukin-15-like isoform X7 n=1 Tax=Pseudophryne corroboree TaxID=495146 RepID=UPI0030814447